MSKNYFLRFRYQNTINLIGAIFTMLPIHLNFGHFSGKIKNNLRKILSNIDFYSLMEKQKEKYQKLTSFLFCPRAKVLY